MEVNQVKPNTSRQLEHISGSLLRASEELLYWSQEFETLGDASSLKLRRAERMVRSCAQEALSISASPQRNSPVVQQNIQKKLDRALKVYRLSMTQW